MYSPKIYPNQVARLYRLKISRLATGEKGTTMTRLVKEAVGRYLYVEEKKLRKENKPFLLIGEPPGGYHE